MKTEISLILSFLASLNKKLYFYETFFQDFHVKKIQWVQLFVLSTTVCENISSIVENRKIFKI